MPPPTIAPTVTRRFVQTIDAPAEKVFPLLCPVREQEWLEGWRCRVIHSYSGLAEEGCVFVVENPDEPSTVWMICEHDPVSLRIGFVMCTPANRVGRLEIVLENRDERSTSVHIRYTFTALSKQGETFIQQYTEDHFRKLMLQWEKSMNHFLKTGQLLRTPES